MQEYIALSAQKTMHIHIAATNISFVFSPCPFLVSDVWSEGVFWRGGRAVEGARLESVYTG